MHNERQQSISEDLLREVHVNVNVDKPRHSFRIQTSVRERNIFFECCENPSEATVEEMKVAFFLKWDMPQSNTTKTTSMKLIDWKFT